MPNFLHKFWTSSILLTFIIYPKYSFSFTTLKPISSLLTRMPPKRFVASKAVSPDVSPSSSPKRRRKSASIETSNEKDEVASPVTTSTIATNEKGPHPRDDIQPILLPTGKNYLKIINWNVNGFKSMATTNLSKFLNLVSNHNPDIICLQETKLQETLVDEYRDILPEYKSYWSCSTVKKGYSGTVRFIYSFLLIIVFCLFSFVILGCILKEIYNCVSKFIDYNFYN